MITVIELVSLASSFLKDRKIAFPRRDSEELLCYVLKCKRLDLYLNYDKLVEEKEISLFRSLIKRRAAHEPVAYIIGSVNFFDCEIFVSKDVLIPRHETEQMVDKITKYIEEKSMQNACIWDLCCGSGCIGIALKKKFPSLSVVMTDIDEYALVMSRKNSLHNKLNIKITQADCLNVSEKIQWDILVCNPPYVSNKEYKKLEKDIIGYEPKKALVSGDEGTEFYERIAFHLKNKKLSKRIIFCEIGYSQENSIKDIFKKYGFLKTKVLRDWYGKNRFFFLEIE